HRVGPRIPSVDVPDQDVDLELRIGSQRCRDLLTEESSGHTAGAKQDRERIADGPEGNPDVVARPANVRYERGHCREDVGKGVDLILSRSGRRPVGWRTTGRTLGWRRIDRLPFAPLPGLLVAVANSRGRTDAPGFHVGGLTD